MVFGSLKPSTYIFGIIIFTFFIMGGIAMIGELRKSDPTFMMDDQTIRFNKTFNKYTDLVTSVSGLQSQTETAENNAGEQGWLNALIGSSWNTLRLLFSSFSFMNDVFLGLTMFGVPAWVGGLLILIPSVIIAFAIYSAIFRTEI